MHITLEGPDIFTAFSSQPFPRVPRLYILMSTFAFRSCTAGLKEPECSPHYEQALTHQDLQSNQRYRTRFFPTYRKLHAVLEEKDTAHEARLHLKYNTSDLEKEIERDNHPQRAVPYVATALFLALSQIGLTEQYRAGKGLAASINVRHALDLLIGQSSWDRKGVVVD